LDHLDVFGDYECHDPRDRIFSLLSLDDRCTYPPDYALTTAEVFLTFAQASVADGFGMQILAQASWQRLEGRVSPELQLPSWVPDWRRPVRDPRVLNPDSLRFSEQWKEELILTECSAELHQAMYKLNDSDWGDTPDSSISISDDGRSLDVSTHIIGVVESVRLDTKAPLTGTRFGDLGTSEFDLRTESCSDGGSRPEDSKALRIMGTDYLTGYHPGCIQCGDTVCRVKDSGFCVALRQHPDLLGTWQLRCWCLIYPSHLDNKSTSPPVTLSIV